MVAEPGVDDHRLVAAVRAGDDRAFELLYSRYHRRIHAYVVGMVKDHGRAEDVTQEVFVSALRRMRETERPIAFKPWIYEIAKNACIDQFRRSKRAEEVSLEADEGFAPSDYGKLVGSEPTPDAAVAAKQDLDHLCGAFGGLSDTHHEILVMRELEGLSYREIGERMGMSRPAVESTLFRARRRLTEEYDDLVSGARCLRIQGLIKSAVSTQLGTRESRRLARHVAHCQPCRREALAAGVDSAILTYVPLPKRAAAKIGSLLPFPLFGRWRGGGDATSANAASGPGWAAHMPILSEQLSGGWGKLATAAAVVVAGVGAAGVGTKVVASGDDAPERAERPAQQAERAATKGDEKVRVRQPARGSAQRAGARRSAKGSRRSGREGDRAGGRGARDRAAGTGTTVPTGTTAGGGRAVGGSTAGGGAGATLPAASLPAAGQDPVKPVKDTVGEVGASVEPVVEGVTDAVEQVTAPVEQVTAPVEETVETVEDTVGDITDGLGDDGDGAAGGGLPLP